MTMQPLSLQRQQWIYQQLELNLESFVFFASRVSQAEAQSLRDGDGWSILEVMAHLRDIEETFLARVETAFLNDGLPFPAFDQNALVIQKNYNIDSLSDVVASLEANRSQLIAKFKTIKDHEWSHVGMHSKRGATSITDLLVQTALHDAKHIRQLSRIFAQKA